MVDIVRHVPDAVEFPWVPKDQKAESSEAPTTANRPGTRRFITIKEDPAAAQIPGLARNRCVEDIYEPGSTFKPFVWATITELGLAKPGRSSTPRVVTGSLPTGGTSRTCIRPRR